MSITPIIISLLALSLVASLQTWINWRQPQPYMDELFHVPQAQEFCAAAVERRLPAYHPSITTPPGLYLPNTILALVTGSTSFCSIPWLRAASGLAAFLCLPLLAEILKSLQSRNYKPPLDSSSNASKKRSNGQDKSAQTWLMALIVWLHPVFLFYGNIFYTDTNSLFWLLVTWYLSLKGKTHASAISGVFSTLVRQPNMIWHAFIVADAIVYDAFFHRAREGGFFGKALAVLRRQGQRNIGNIIGFLLYLGFLIWNGGVAVGDKDHHEITLHYAMFPYFLGFHAVSYLAFQFLTPCHLLNELRTLCSAERAFLFLSSCVFLAVLVTATADRVHPFILADNRHFTFYLYRRWILRSPVHRLVLVPLYAWPLLNCYNECAIAHHVSEESSNRDSRPMGEDSTLQAEALLDRILFACACVALIPSGLLELRYFTAVNTILTLRRMSRKRWEASILHSVAISALCMSVNLLLVFIFAEMPFERPIDSHMPTDESSGRFMF